MKRFAAFVLALVLATLAAIPMFSASAATVMNTGIRVGTVDAATIFTGTSTGVDSTGLRAGVDAVDGGRGVGTVDAATSGFATLSGFVPFTANDAQVVKMYVTASNGGSVNLRALPNKSAKAYFLLGVGRPVEVIESLSTGWSYVRVQVSGSYYYGYMMSAYLGNTDPSTARQSFQTVATPFSVHVVTASASGTVSMWTTTDKANEHKLRDLSTTESLTVIAASNAWYKVTDSFGNVGFVAKAYVMK